jgi:hypothetical protein
MMNAKPSMPLPNETTTALEAKNGWKTMMRKATWWKMKAAKADNIRIEMVYDKTLTKQNGEWVKPNHQPMTSNYHDMKI